MQHLTRVNRYIFERKKADSVNTGVWRENSLYFCFCSPCRYEQQLREKLARRRERLAKGLPPEDSDDEDETKQSTDGVGVLESLEQR